MASHLQRKLLAAGSRAPDFQLARLNGGQIRLAEIAANGPALLVFFKVTCPVCQMALPYLERIHVAGMPMFGISQDDSADTHDFAREFGLSFPMLLDSVEEDYPVSNAYGISSVPTMFLVEPDGTLAQVTEGWRKADIERLAALVGAAVFTPNDNVPAWKPG
jgi:peroxiredoxin